MRDLFLREDQNVSRKQTVEDSSRTQTEDGTQSIFESNMSAEETSKTESVFGQNIPSAAAELTKTESVFASVPEPKKQNKEAPRPSKTGKKKSTSKKGVWIAIVCAAVIVVAGFAFTKLLPALSSLHVIQIGDQSISVEDESVRFAVCFIDTLKPLLNMPNLREVEFCDVAFGEENPLEPLKQIKTLKRIILRNINDALDVAGFPLDVEIVSDTPYYIDVDLGYGERLSLQDLEMPFDVGQRTVTYGQGSSEAAWIDEETQEIVTTSVRPVSLFSRKHSGIDISDVIVFPCNIENMDVEVQLMVSIKNDPDYGGSPVLEEMQFPRTLPAPFYMDAYKIEPGIEGCYGFDYEYFYGIDSGHDNDILRFCLYISQDGNQWQKVYAGTYEFNKNITIPVRLDKPTDFLYFCYEMEYVDFASTSFYNQDITALYLTAVEAHETAP